MSLSQRPCLYCGELFQPKREHAKFCSTNHRTYHARSQKRLALLTDDQRTLLNMIRERDLEIAIGIEQMIAKHGIECADEVLTHCWKAMNRAALRLANEMYSPVAS